MLLGLDRGNESKLNLQQLDMDLGVKTGGDGS